jgi:hypothetical protein
LGVSVSGDDQLPLISFEETVGYAMPRAVVNNHGQQCSDKNIFKKEAALVGG